jgi:hypothetical protein
MLKDLEVCLVSNKQIFLSDFLVKLTPPMKMKHLLTKVEWKKTVVSFVQGHDLNTTTKKDVFTQA